MDEASVQLPLSDLELIRAALNSAYHQNHVLDIADQYRKMSQRAQSSAMTKSLEGALGVIDSYLAEEEDEPVQ